MVNGSIINKIKLPNILVEDEFNYYHKKFLNGDYKSLEILVLHNLKLVYKQPGLTSGITISSITLIITIIYLTKKKY